MTCVKIQIGTNHTIQKKVIQKMIFTQYVYNTIWKSGLHPIKSIYLQIKNFQNYQNTVRHGVKLKTQIHIFLDLLLVILDTMHVYNQIYLYNLQKTATTFGSVQRNTVTIQQLKIIPVILNYTTITLRFKIPVVLLVVIN